MNNKDNTKRIVISEEYQLKIEESEALKTSVFREVYEKAAVQVADISKWTKKILEEKEDSENRDFYRDEQENNNIIAFVGERGTGKTSGMITMGKALMAAHNKGNWDWIRDDKVREEIQFFRYESVRTIDPSRFESNENIIEVIIAELFSRFQRKVKDEAIKVDKVGKREVLEAFQKVYKSLKIIRKDTLKDKYDGEPLESLNSLAEGAGLREDIVNLIKIYLKFIHPDQAIGKSVLVIPIDDFDLNVKHACEMAEQIRKYLMIPQVLILMAVNMEQFLEVKEQEVISDFQVLLEHGDLASSTKSITNRYVQKLIPFHRRMFLPDLLQYFQPVLIEFFGQKLSLEESLKKSITKFIYENTGLILCQSDDSVYPLFPKSLRELVSFMKVLSRFDQGNKKENLLIIEEYFWNWWVADNLSFEQQNKLNYSRNLPHIDWNKFLILTLHNFISDSNKQEVESINGIKEIVSRNNHAANVSLGDYFY